MLFTFNADLLKWLNTIAIIAYTIKEWWLILQGSKTTLYFLNGQSYTLVGHTQISTTNNWL